MRRRRLYAPVRMSMPLFRRALALAALLCTLFCAVRPVLAAPEDDFDISTPRRAVSTFLDAAARNDWQRASRVLDGREGGAVPEARVDVTQRLHYLLTHKVWFDIDELSDDPNGKPEDGADLEKVGRVRLDDGEAPITLTKLKGQPVRWVFSPGTLARVPELYAQVGPPALDAHVPPAFRARFLGLALWQWVGLALSIVLSVIVGRGVVFLIRILTRRLVAKTKAIWDDELVLALRSPARLFFGLLAFFSFDELLGLPTSVRKIVVHIAGTMFVIAIAWMLTRASGVIADVVERNAMHHAALAPDAALRSRGVRTQVRVLHRVANMVVAVLTTALLLMQFDVVRNVGVSLLASAGIAGVVLGLAAQQTIGSLFAGIQLSATQPIRIGDSVVVEGEFGTIEEITLTYVVVKVWDERRLVVPIKRFLEQPFQNWTKVSPELHGTVMLYADWSLPIDAVRAELDRLLEGNARWDRRTKAVHVTEANERTLQVRILVSAADSGALFDLRAELREKLVGWLQHLDGGRHLPKLRYAGEGSARTAPPEAYTA